MKIKKIFGAALLLIGVLVMLYPVGTRLYAAHQKKQLIAAIKEQMQLTTATQKTDLQARSEEQTAIVVKSQELEELDVEEVELSEEEKRAQTEEYRQKMTETLVGEQHVIGLLEIPSLNIIEAVVEGAEADNIVAAVGHITGTGELGTVGNCVIAGHRGGLYGTIFRYLSNIKTEDVVRITDAYNQVFSYEVYETFIVDPDDMTVTQSLGEEKILTLITCENNAKQRLIVRARLKEGE